jgi:hypothetical protein
MTLEWQVSSPPPVFNFDSVPTVVGGPYEYGIPGAVHGSSRRSGAGQVGAGSRLRGAHEAGRPVKEILVIANRTLGGAAAEAVRAHAAEQAARFRLVVPQSHASAGFVIYDDAVHSGPGARRSGTLHGRQGGHRGERRGRRRRPVPATMDAVAERRPTRSSSDASGDPVGWLRGVT